MPILPHLSKILNRFLDVTESMVDDIRDGKYVNNEDEECLFAVGKERCNQFDNRVSTPFLTGEDISNLNAINTENGAVIVFLENGQKLCLAKLTGKKGEKQIVYNYEEKIKSLQLSVIGESDIMVSAVGQKNITQSTIDSDNLNVINVGEFLTDEVNTLDDFINIVYNNPLKLTTSFPYATFSTSQINSEATVTSPLATTDIEEVTTKRSTITVEEDITSTEITAQHTITEQKTTGYITAATTASTTASPKTTTSTERAATTAKTTAETGTTQHTTTTKITRPTTVTSSKITTLAEKTTVSTNQATKTSTTKVIPPTTKVTAKRTIRSTSHYTTSTERDSTTTIIQGTIAMDSTTRLTTLASTIGSAIITTLGSVTQSTTNMLTTDNYPMIMGNSSEFNQTSASPDFEARSLNTAEISAAVAMPIVVVIGVSCLIYRQCCHSNIRLPSDYIDDVGFWQRFISCFNRSRETVPELQLEPLDNNVNQVDSNEYEINQNSASNSREDLLKQNQSGATYSTFSPASNANSKAGRSRSNSEESTESMKWDNRCDTGSVQYKEEDETAHNETNVSLELNNAEVSSGTEQNRTIEVSDSPV